MLMDVRIGTWVCAWASPKSIPVSERHRPMLMLPRIGLARTMELTLTGRMMEAQEAASIGLINYLVERPEGVMPNA